MFWFPRKTKCLLLPYFFWVWLKLPPKKKKKTKPEDLEHPCRVAGSTYLRLGSRFQICCLLRWNLSHPNLVSLHRGLVLLKWCKEWQTHHEIYISDFSVEWNVRRILKTRAFCGWRPLWRKTHLDKMVKILGVELHRTRNRGEIKVLSVFWWWVHHTKRYERVSKHNTQKWRA